MKTQKKDLVKALETLSATGDPRLLLIEHLGFEHARTDNIDRSRWPKDWEDSVLDSRFIAERSGFRVASVIVSDSTPVNKWRAIAVRILIDYGGLALVCIHSKGGQRWLWSSSSLEHRRTAAALLQGIRHLTVEVGSDGSAPEGFITLLSRIDVSHASGDLDVLAKVSEAFDKYTMDLQSDIGKNVYDALRVLTEGLLSYKPNALSRDVETLEKIRSEVFILLYRFLFVLYSESRDIFPVDNHVYFEKYSMSWWNENVTLPVEKNGSEALRDIGGSGGTTLWQRCRSLFHLIMTGSVLQGHKPAEFDFRAYYGTIFDTELHMDLERWEIPNQHLADAVRVLTRFRDEAGSTFFVDYSSLETRHIGSIYERLLEYHLALDSSRNVVHTMDELERKSTGSYYTPESLIKRLVSNTLDPILGSIQEEIGSGNPELFEKRVYSLRICDPAMGSGHFLVGVIDRLARAVLEYREAAGIVVDETEFVEIKRTLVRRSIYGVDLNPLAVELAKMSLWLETLNSDRPLSFLDAHLKTGNSIVGAWLKSLSDPQRSIIDTDIRDHIRDEVGELITIERQEELVAVDVQQKVRKYRELRSTNTRYGRLMRLLDAQIVSFFGGSVDDWRAARELLKNTRGFDAYVSKPKWNEAFEIARRAGFYHWELEFPEVFFSEDGRRREDPGFDVVVGNPPWNKIKTLDREFFRYRAPSIANAQTAAAREKAIVGLKHNIPVLWKEYDNARQDSQRLAEFLRLGGQYPLSARGDINYYPIFVERATGIVKATGRIGMITPTGIVTDFGNQHILASLLDSGKLSIVEDFENKGLFPDVDDRFRFSLIVISANRTSHRTRIASCLHDPSEADDSKRWFELEPEDISIFNPNTRTIPLFCSRIDAKINEKMYRKAGTVFLDESRTEDGNRWNAMFYRMFDMTNDSAEFHTRAELGKNGWKLHGGILLKKSDRMIPLLEAKMMHFWNPRFATSHDACEDDIRKGLCRNSTLTELSRSEWEPLPRYWVSDEAATERWKKANWSENWVLVFRGLSRGTDERTLIATFAPRYAFGNSSPVILSHNPPREVALLLANMSSLPLDYCARNKTSGANMNFFIVQQLPLFPPKAYAKWELDGDSLSDRLSTMALKLSCTSQSLRSLADSSNHEPAIAKWKEGERFGAMRTIDAVFAHMYGLSRDEFSYVLDSFSVLRDNEASAYGEYRTKNQALKEFDALEGRLRHL